MRPRYTGPLIVISRNRGGAYILAELNGALFNRPVTAFQVIPYFARKHIELPPLAKLLDVSIQRLRELENTSNTDNDEFNPEEVDQHRDDSDSQTEAEED